MTPPVAPETPPPASPQSSVAAVAPWPPAPPAPSPVPLLLTGIVVHWRDEARLAELIAAWPDDDPRFELLVVDNSGSASPALPAAAVDASGARATASGPAATVDASAAQVAPSARTTPVDASPARVIPGPAAVRLLRPGRNLGFAGGVNAGVAASRAPLLLLLNPDAMPEPGTLDRLLEGFAAHPEAAGLAPRLAGPGGEPQFAWQLRPLPSAWDCLRQTLPWPGAGGPARPAVEPPSGTLVEQPAAAALALRRAALDGIGGFDERFHPAWFEDVDLARRLRRSGARIVYWPAARFRHVQGSTVPRLGYGRFLWIYHRNLERYLAKHHGAAWALAARATLVAGLVLRLPLVAFRRPRRAASRRAAAAGLLLALAGALSGWRLPRGLSAGDAGDAANAGEMATVSATPTAGDVADPAVPPARRRG